jgi:hypothetical protein
MAPGRMPGLPSATAILPVPIAMSSSDTFHPELSPTDAWRTAVAVEFASAVAESFGGFIDRRIRGEQHRLDRAESRRFYWVRGGSTS